MSETAVVYRHSITSLTLGILSILLPVIGLILGVIGVITSRKAVREMFKVNDSNKSLATSGLICSVVGIIVQVFVIISFISFYLLVSEG